VKDETARIRSVFAERDRTRTSAIVRAGYELLTSERRTKTIDLVRRRLPEARRPAILDVGCGGGQDLEWWREQGWPPERLSGIDLVAERVESARARCPEVDIRLGDGPKLPFGDNTFAVATASTVFSSIPESASRQSMFREMSRVVAPGGLLILYDFVIRNPRNSTAVPMTTSRLLDLAGRGPDESYMLSPFLYAIGPIAIVSPRIARIVGSALPRTHRLSLWRV